MKKPKNRKQAQPPTPAAVAKAIQHAADSAFTVRPFARPKGILCCAPRDWRHPHELILMGVDPRYTFVYSRELDPPAAWLADHLTAERHSA